MNIEEFRDYCLKLPGVTEDLPFGPDVLVFKVMGKLFALTDIDGFESVNLKCKPEDCIELRERYSGIIAGYHMNKKHWNTVYTDGSVSDEMIKKLISISYELVVDGLTRKQKEELKTR